MASLTMFSHADIWRAIDTLARVNGLSTSGLARKAGLDPTSFNRSKRITPAGRPRWPSSESLAKVLKCTNTTLEEFARLMNGHHRSWRLRVPVLEMAQAQGLEHFADDGAPQGDAWQRLDIPGMEDDAAFALRIGDIDAEPFCRDGDTILVSPRARLHPGDRVLLQRRDGALMLGELRRRDSQTIELAACGAARRITRLARDECRWLARVHCVLLGTVSAPGR